MNGIIFWEVVPCSFKFLISNGIMNTGVTVFSSLDEKFNPILSGFKWKELLKKGNSE